MDNKILIECGKCKQNTFVLEGEGVGCGVPEKHYPIGYCKMCDSKMVTK